MQRFRDLTGVTFWSTDCALMFCCTAFYNQYGGGDGSQQEYKYLWIDPRVILGTSKISQSDFDTILKMISKPIGEFAAGYALPSKAGPGCGCDRLQVSSPRADWPVFLYFYQRLRISRREDVCRRILGRFTTANSMRIGSSFPSHGDTSLSAM